MMNEFSHQVSYEYAADIVVKILQEGAEVFAIQLSATGACTKELGRTTVHMRQDELEHLPHTVPMRAGIERSAMGKLGCNL